MVKIFSGDDTDFRGDQRLALTFTAPDVNFTGCTAEIEFLGQRRTFAQVTDGGRLAFSFSADETRGMRCGIWPVTIRLRDATGRVRTVDNTQRIKVTNDVNDAYADTEQELSVSLRSGGVAMPDIPMDLDAVSADSVGEFKTKFNRLLTLLRNVSTVAVAVLIPFAANAASVTTAPLNEIPGTARIVTGVDLPDVSSFATKQSVAVVSNAAVRAESKADAVVAYLLGDDVKEVVTNYDSAVHMPSRSLQQRMEVDGSNVWRVVWDEMTRWDWLTGTYLPANFYDKTQVDDKLDDKADRAWGFYDSHTGGWSPDGYLQISSPKILIAAGMAYQRHIVTGGAVWVLESNGLVTEVGGITSNGFFRITDDDKNALFEIVKGNKRTIGATAAGFAVTNIMGIAHCYIPYNVESAEHPKILAGTELGEFVSEESASSIVNVSWTGESGAWRAEVWPKVATQKLFIKAEYQVGGETYIKNAAPVDVSEGLLCTDGVHRVRPVYSNGTVTWEVMQ